jgi:hypothetical protein
MNFIIMVIIISLHPKIASDLGRKNIHKGDL